MLRHVQLHNLGKTNFMLLWFELYCAEDAVIKYSTVQIWYSGNSEGKGVVYNFVTKRGICSGPCSSISWTQVETGSAITWKYPSFVLEGEFYSVGRHRIQDDSQGKEYKKQGHVERGQKRFETPHNAARCLSVTMLLPTPTLTLRHKIPNFCLPATSFFITHQLVLNMKPEPLKLVKIFYFQQRGIGP
ncbi:SUF system FeS cluster assembly, SufBD [Gossypium australe]|uniref:SUF system FeS cluster assembly, SufBD n=1 Tax=Gossypium australe TaxID=47621 RepID=A0A5B6V7S5_9ROSI|nr:SUF system FeS cluster assembly, SufBD [Gossypium australe]